MYRFIVILILLVSVSFGQTSYYIDADKGDDTNNGLTKDAWQVSVDIEEEI